MHRTRDALDRIIPALLMAVGVMLVASGLLSLAPPVASDQPSAAASRSASSPSRSAGPTAPRPTELAVEITLPPTPSPSSAATGSVPPAASSTPSASPSPRPTLPDGEMVVVSRVRVPALRIDLPVLSGAFDPPGNPGTYPLCDIAQFLISPGLVQPYEEGTTYVYAHARTGMFLPLLEASMRRNGAEMLGALVELYTNDGGRYLYEIFKVKRHATDLALAFDLPPGEHRLILQTSEGPAGTIPKLQVAARLLDVGSVSLAEANPEPHPRICG